MNKCKGIRKRIRNRYEMYTQSLEEDFWTTVVLTVFIVVALVQFVLLPYRLEQWERERKAEEQYHQEMVKFVEQADKIFDEIGKEGTE